MPGNRENGAAMHQTTVILRSDIYRKALEQGIDISAACNQALADLTGSASPRNGENKPAPAPVIVAKDGAVPRISHGSSKATPGNLHPVINADDPAAPSKLVRTRSAPKNVPEPAPAPGPVLAGEPEMPQEPPAGPSPGPAGKAGLAKSRAPTRKKPAKGEALKSFFSKRITRTGDAGDCVGKDELYELFARFCRDNHISPVPERKTVTIALKNQFALTEKPVDGTPSWTGIRLS